MAMVCFKISHVPYRSGAPALQDALAGRVPLSMSGIVIILSHIREGRLIPLGVSSAQTSRFLPQVPTFAAQRLPGCEALTFGVMVGPAPAMNARMQGALRQVLGEVPVQLRMAGPGGEIVAAPPAETGAFIRNEITKRGEVSLANNIRSES